MRRAGRADAGEDDALRGRDCSAAVSTRRHGRPEVLEGVEHARRVAGAVVDDVDHPRPRVANRLTVDLLQWSSIRRPEPPIFSVMHDAAHPAPHCSRRRSRAAAPARAGAVLGRTRRLPPAGHPARAPPPSDGAPDRPGSRSWASRLTADQLVAYYQKRSGLRVPRHRRDVAAARADVRDRRKPLQRAWRHRVRAVDHRDGMVQLPRQRHRRARTTTTSRASARATRAGTGSSFRARSVGVRAQIQLLRNYADSTLVAPAPSPILRCPSSGGAARDRGVQLRPLLRQGQRAALEQHGQRQLGDSPNYANGLEETDTSFAIEWKGHYRIEGPAFIYSDRDTGRVTTILGDPTQSIFLKPADLKISNIFGEYSWIEDRKQEYFNI